METVNKIYKTPECTRRAIKKYIDKNSVILNAKNLENYHKNMQNPEYKEKRRLYDRERKQKKAILLKPIIDDSQFHISLGEKRI